MSENFSQGIAHKDLNCPECGAWMEMIWTNYRYRNGERRPIYRCLRFPECSGTHGAHPNGAPLGIPADKETRRLRIRVHAELDRVFPPRMDGRREIGRFRRKERIYEWLGTQDLGHVSSMTSIDCRRILKLLSTMDPMKR